MSDDMIAFDPGLVLLPAKESSIFQKETYDRYTFSTLIFGYFKVISVLLTKVIEFYM